MFYGETNVIWQPRFGCWIINHGMLFRFMGMLWRHVWVRQLRQAAQHWGIQAKIEMRAEELSSRNSQISDSVRKKGEWVGGICKGDLERENKTGINNSEVWCPIMCTDLADSSCLFEPWGNNGVEGHRRARDKRSLWMSMNRTRPDLAERWII